MACAYVFLYNSSGSQLTYNYYSGPDDNGFISNYVLPADPTDTYYVLVQRYTGVVGEYQLRVERARGIDLETDYDYSNDSFSGANPVTLTESGNQRSGVIAGTIMARQGSNTDEDRFQLGLLNAGNVIDLSSSLPSSSSLVPSLRVYDGGGTELLDEDGDPSNGFGATVLTDGDYYAEVSSYWIYNGKQYSLTPSLTWSDAEAAAVAEGGHLVTVNDQAEQDFLCSAFCGIGNYWIGLNDYDTENTFVWADGSSSSYENWGPNEPNSGANYDGIYVEDSNGLWYDGYVNWVYRGVVEQTAPQGTSGGPGALAQYLLNVTVSDPVPPQVASVSRLPDGGTTSELISTFDATFSEALDPATVNTPVYTYAINPSNNHLYLLSDSSQTWNQAEAQAQSLGGHLVTIDDPTEQDWIVSEFGGYSSSFWIGLSDQSEQGNWTTWADGTPVVHENWHPSYPISNSGYDFGYLYVPDGLWYNYPNTTSSSWRGLIEIPGGAGDGDGDGTPDAVDSHPADRFNGWDLRAAGPDGIFDSPGTPRRGR